MDNQPVHKRNDFFGYLRELRAMDQAAVVSQFVALTNCTEAEASFYLEAANYDLDRAVAMFFGKLQAR